MTQPAELDCERIYLKLHNGLPYLDFSVFKKLRPLMSKHYKATCCAIPMTEDADPASSASQAEEDRLTHEGAQCAEAVGVDELHRLRAFPDSKTQIVV